MLSQDLKDLHREFSDWINGRGAPFSVEQALRFERRLRHGIARAALLELGVDPAAFDRAGPDAPPAWPANVALFPADRIIRRKPAPERGQP
jgi:hypothetical protein